MVGTIKNLAGVGLSGYTMRLYSDANNDGVADSLTTVRAVLSNSTGVWSMASLPPGNYILEQGNGAVATTVSILDSAQPTSDGITDTLTVVAPTAHPNNYAVKVIIRPLQVQGPINVIMNL